MKYRCNEGGGRSSERWYIVTTATRVMTQIGVREEKK